MGDFSPLGDTAQTGQKFTSSGIISENQSEETMVICEIEFTNNPRGIFYAGQLISGQVVIKTEKAKPVKGKRLIHGFHSCYLFCRGELC